MPLTPFSNDLLTYPMRSFTDHLHLPDNNNILFSGKFGTGKTYFLKNYFNQEWQQSNFQEKKYNVVHISPVNYSISSTEDIFEFIKYDVIVNLLSQEEMIEGNDLDSLGKLGLFLQEHQFSVFRKFLAMHPKIGKSAETLLTTLEEIKKLFTEVTKSNGDLLVNYLKKLQQESGSLFENDIITRLIHYSSVKKKDDGKFQNVLVIDDLDRIDPEHIFRILNVFAAHLDAANGNNKLGFDKIIVVCDIRNIRNIFQARFGTETDFNGYIDKFYSTEIFYFDNREIVENIATKAFINFRIVARDEQESKYQTSKLSRRPDDFCYPMLLLFVKNGFLNLRVLASRLKQPLIINEQDAIRFDNGDLNDRKINHSLIVHLTVLKNLVGSYDDIRYLLKRIPDRYLHWSQQELYRYCTQIIKELLFEETKWQIKPGYKSMSLNERQLRYDLDEQNMEISVTDTEIGVDGARYTFTKSDFRTLFSELIDLLKRIDYKA